ncbi:uncharacterized protein [Nicotiana sylvestris]|uniref:uncharacterized protein n=1 Tax=Nicotiana sylvestris TaxID=4096 RepID=UPI00388C69AB
MGTQGIIRSPLHQRIERRPHSLARMAFMPFGLYNAPATFQRCMMDIFTNMVEDIMEVFMDDFSVVGNSFDECLINLTRVLKRYIETNLVLNWEKCHFMVQEGIVLGHRVSSKGIEVDRAKVDVIAKLPPLTSVKAIRSFLGHAGFYRRFIRDFSKIANPLYEQLLATSLEEVPWYADFANYLASDYVSKWVEDATFPTNDARMVVGFLKKNIFTRFGTPRAIISDGGTHFYNRAFEKLLAEYDVRHKVATPYHPQTSGQLNLDIEAASTTRITEFHELDEFRHLAFESTRLYKERMKRLHDQNIVERQFKPGDMVLLYNSRLQLFPGKLKSRWSGPFRVVEVFPSGAVEIASEKDSHIFRVNGQRLKLYIGVST